GRADTAASEASSRPCSRGTRRRRGGSRPGEARRVPYVRTLPQDWRVTTSRLEAFSDGVFAIAITLLVLEFGVDTATHDLGSQLLHIWPSYLAYVTSFLTIGVIWVNHHALFDFVGRVDRALLFLNTLLLLVIAFTPFPTRLIAEFLREGDNERTAALAYGIT